MKIPLVAHFHGYDASGYKILKKYTERYRQLFDQAASIICVSAEMKHRLISMGAPEKKLYTIPYGIDLNKFYPSPSKEKDCLFLSVGRFVAKKAPLESLLAFKKVWEKYPAAKLIMIGDGKGLLEACKKMVRTHHLEQAVTFMGPLPPDQVADFMQRSTIFIQHSVTPPTGDMEGTPNSILEAAACGLPVVSTLHGGIKEAVIHGKTGFLVEENDVEGMAAYMLKLIKQKELISSMGDAARRHIELNYDINKQISKLFNVIQATVHR